MNLPTEIFGDVVVVHTPEELASDQADAFAVFLRGLDTPQVVLDVDGTETLTSAGLEALLDVQDERRAQGGDVKVAAAGTVNRKILEITRLDAHLEVYGSVLEAVKSFN